MVQAWEWQLKFSNRKEIWQNKPKIYWLKKEMGSAGNAERNLYILLVCSWEIKFNYMIKNYFRGDVVSSSLLLHNLQVKTFKSGGKELWVMTIVPNKTLPVFVTGLVWVSGEQRRLWVTQCRAGSEMAYSGSQVKDTVMA